MLHIQKIKNKCYCNKHIKIILLKITKLARLKQLVRVARVTPKPLDFTDLITWIIKLKNWTDLDTNSPIHQKQDIDSPDYWSKRLGQIDFTNINGCKIEKYAKFTQYLLKLSHIS